jgi:hypothetical protein
MTQIVINSCDGGYGLSQKAYEYLGLEWDGYGYAMEEDRTNPDLIRCVMTLGVEADGEYAKLTVINIPDDVQWEIQDYDGNEWVAENHRTWL